MRVTGIVRKIYNLGRIVVPKETRRNLQVDSGDTLEIFVEEDAIILQKYTSHGTCHHGRNICKKCKVGRWKADTKSRRCKKIVS